MSQDDGEILRTKRFEVLLAIVGCLYVACKMILQAYDNLQMKHLLKESVSTLSMTCPLAINIGYLFFQEYERSLSDDAKMDYRRKKLKRGWWTHARWGVPKMLACQLIVHLAAMAILSLIAQEYLQIEISLKIYNPKEIERLFPTQYKTMIFNEGHGVNYSTIGCDCDLQINSFNAGFMSAIIYWCTICYLLQIGEVLIDQLLFVPHWRIHFIKWTLKVRGKVAKLIATNFSYQEVWKLRRLARKLRKAESETLIRDIIDQHKQDLADWGIQLQPSQESKKKKLESTVKIEIDQEKKTPTVKKKTPKAKEKKIAAKKQGDQTKKK